MAVHVEKDGPVTTIILSRPEVRNAVDRETAQELADAFRGFKPIKRLGSQCLPEIKDNFVPAQI